MIWLPSGSIPREGWFLILMAVTVAWLWTPLSSVISLSLRYGTYEHYSHIILIPFASAYLLYLQRQWIFAEEQWSPSLGTCVFLLGGAVSSLSPADDPITFLSVAMLSMVVMCWGAFVLCYGWDSFKRAAFGMCLLLLMVPLPSIILDTIIGILQRASADTSDVLFRLLGVPVFREGFVFQLPELTIKVGRECSGIRSSLALLICGLIAGHLFLSSIWAKLVLILVVFPLTIAKNALRIVSLSMLGNYVDPSFLTDSLLHRNGGIPFFLTSLMVLGVILWLLQKSETRLAYRWG